MVYVKYSEIILKKLEVINQQLAENKESKRKFYHILSIILSIIVLMIFVGILTLGNFYMDWNYNDPELAVLGVGIHSFVWIFVRLAPIILIGLIVAIFLTRKNK